jgi:hypothetical protein
LYDVTKLKIFLKILLIVKIVDFEDLLNLVLIQWYDFKSESHPYLCRYPLLKLTEIYNFIDIKAIQNIVHIVPRFDKSNEFFVNKYIF